MFSIILPGRPCLVNYVPISPTQFAFSFPSAPHFSHIVVFILPGNLLPPETAAAVYLQSPGQAEFQLLGAIGNEKPSAIFKVNLQPGAGAGETQEAVSNGAAHPRVAGAEVVNVGISVEPVATIQGQLAQLPSLDSPTSGAASTALVKRPPGTKVLAQRIIRNAFNFLASFAGSRGDGGLGGQEMVPLKSFQDWWAKFERKIEVDPGFLEREEEG